MMSSKTTTATTATMTDDTNSSSSSSRAEGTRDDINKLMIHNFINGEFVPSTKAAASSSSSNNNNSGGGETETTTTTKITILNPSTDEILGEMMNSSLDDVNHVVDVASTAFHEWKKLTMKARCSIMYRFHHLIRLHTQELADIIVKENGKNITEAIADIAKGNETIEYACSLASSDIAAGRTLQVSSGPVYCEDRREPLGVICSIVPFNFPFMVPMWTIPIALVLGNTVILKPSEKVPLTMYRVVELMNDAGFPKGIFNMIQGTKDVVDELIKHPKISAITFVGSSIVAKHVADTTRLYNNKRVTALGGAKNHLIVIEEEDVNTCRHLQTTTANDIVISFCGCAGQRCMAASVLLLIPTTKTTTTTISPPEEEEIEEEISPLLRAIIDKASKIEPGTGPKQMGPVIDKASYDKIIRYIELAETKDGAKVLLDGRKTPWSKHNNNNAMGGGGGGNWIGPTILLHSKSTDVTMCEEVFGPVLSVYICRGDNNNNNTIKTTNDNSANDVNDTVVPPSSWFEAIEIENRNPYGNAATIYTNDGGIADWFTKRFRAAMLGINIGIPVPREPFSFGGLYGTKSKYGDMDITGDGAVEFFTNRIKVTSKWPKITTSLTSITTTATRSSITTSSENVENGEKCKTATTTTTTDAASSSSSDKDHANFAGSM